MKTDRNIPWEAVVDAKPRTRARSLPLTITRSFWKRSGAAQDATAESTLLDTVAAAFSENPLAIVSRSGPSALVELALPDGSIVVLTGGPNNSVLQLQYVPQTSRPTLYPELRRDALLRTHVLRHARFDPDDRAFTTTPDPDTEQDMRRSPRFEFVRPENWGFTRSHRGYRWTAENLFKSAGKPSRLRPVTRPRYHDPFEDSATAATPDRGDPCHGLPQLRQALSVGSCHELAIALGRCRLFGVTTTGPDDVTLSPQSLRLALDELPAYLANLPADIESCAPHRAQTLALELLEARMDLWAAWIALDEAYAAALLDGDADNDHLGQLMRTAADQIENFDANLEKQSAFLTPAAGTLLLTNWRRLLAPAYHETLPWWLDGSLEATAQ